MTANEVLAYLYRHGATVSIDGDFIELAGNLAFLTDDVRTAIRASKPELLKLLRQLANDPEPIPEPIVEPPPHVARCPRCHAADWGCVGSASDGAETWGCLTCWTTNPRPTRCPSCQQDYLVYDQIGAYCVACRWCSGDRPPAEKEEKPSSTKNPVFIGVRWSPYRGYLRVTNPVTVEIEDLRNPRIAQGCAMVVWSPQRSTEKDSQP